MSLKTYLQKHFVDKPTFVSLLGITIERLDQLIAAQAVPQPTYVCDGNTISSAVLGLLRLKNIFMVIFFVPNAADGSKSQIRPRRAKSVMQCSQY